MSNTRFPVTEWIWTPGGTKATKSNCDVSDFLRRPVPWHGRFRVLSLLRDSVIPALEPVLAAFLERHRVPNEFFLERDQSVNHGFGTFTDVAEQRTVTWMRLVSKSVQVQRDDKGRPLHIATPVISSDKKQDRAWYNFAFVLIEEKDASGGSDQSTLLCFDAPYQFLKELNELQVSEAHLNDAFFMLNLVLSTLFKVMDDVAWTLADVFRNIEKDTLERTAQDKRAGKSIDFSELHNISKHQIYMSEAFQAAQYMSSDLLECYRTRSTTNTIQSAQNIEQKLLHSARMFKATHLRLASLEKRIANITSLAFNIVTQEDSRSMHTIALITLVFLPSTLIATVFSSSFFDFSVEDDQTSGVHLSSLFWVFWVIAIPVTAIVVYLWWNFSPRKKEFATAA